jgi:tetratricopeptide (TPR) repeat protein
MSDRLTRKEIKRQDSFQVTMAQSLEWVRSHRRALIAGAATLVLAVVALGAWAFWVRLSEDEAQALLAEAMAAHRAPIEPAGEAAAAAGDDEPSFPSEEARRSRAQELFEQVVEEHGASDAADVARVYLAYFAAGAGDAERARELWQDFLDEHPEHMLGAEVRLNLYALDRAAGRGEEVAAELRTMLEQDDRPLPEDVVLHELAVTLEALDREEEATEHYQRLASEFPQSPFALAARQKTGAPAPFAGLGT